MIPWELFTYSLDLYPFPDIVSDALNVRDLTTLSANLPRRTWQTDQQSPWHPPFYASFLEWRDVYEDFIREVVVHRLDEPCYYQRVPTFRVHLPNNTAVGEFHTDAQYHHPTGEVSFWLPLTRAAGTSSVWIEDDDHEYRDVVAAPGEVVQFNAAQRLHGNLLNETGKSRVSFDFRLLPVRLAPTTEGPPTKHTKLRFAAGGYYANEIVRP